MVHSAYEINDLVPNAELMLFKIFCSPLCTKEQRKSGDKDDILAGNLFRHPDSSLGNSVYRSLLETVAL